MKQKIFLPKSFGFNEYFDEKYWAKITFACLLTYLLTFPLSDLSINLWKKLFLVFNPQGMITEIFKRLLWQDHPNAPNECGK